RNPRIGKVLLRAHQDAAGRLLGPQVMYQVVDPGGWNLEALDGPAAPEGPPATGIVLTGRMGPGERAEAEAEAARRGPAWTAIFDPQAGWLLLPPTQKPRE
ncbi:MAG TPA: hypothetical protein VHV47_15300, partial [Opitutaceae bacterium]|nr:hypothetical protein [Opitutaceae bacterium]